jgi:hypothetical protein
MLLVVHQVGQLVYHLQGINTLSAVEIGIFGGQTFGSSRSD